MDFDSLDALIPEGDGRGERYRWREDQGHPSEGWGPAPIDWAGFANGRPFRWLEIDASPGSRVRVTDGATRSPGDFLIFVEVVTEGGTTVLWRPMTYREVCWDLFQKANFTAPSARHMRGQFLPAALALTTGQTTLERAVSNLGGRNRGLDRIGASRRQLLTVLLAAAVEEERNYPENFVRGGGRYLPVRLAAAVVWGGLSPRSFDALGASGVARGSSSVPALVSDAAAPSFVEIWPDVRLPGAHERSMRKEWFRGKVRRLP